jgi:subtilisin family serine protease
MRDTVSHGTSIVGLIAGAMGGVNPNALIIPLALGPSMFVVCILRALRTILALQLGTATLFSLTTGIFTPRRAVLNFSIGTLFLPDIGLGVGAHDVWEDMLPRLNAYNVDVVTSAGNDGPKAFVSNTSPQINGGPDSKLIIVGATDASGFPTGATQFAPPRLALVDIYAIGQDVLVPWADVPIPGQDNRFATVSGTSFAAPIVAGLLSMLIARQDVTGTVNNGVKAKDVLRNQAVNLKGRDWPNIEGYFIPRAATPWGPIACPQPARPIKTMTSFSLQNVPTDVPDIAASAVTLNFASYTVARPVSYVFSILIRPMMPL